MEMHKIGEGNLEVKFPTIFGQMEKMEKQSWEESEKRKEEENRSERKYQKKMQAREKVEKSHCFGAPEQ
jgi:transposase